ncbi:MAG: rhomboid family intramembrane serine protease [Agrococcus casei]|uniref:rhomboid family intramembrane serine protease n=1 Tax=Agrococcus casei TaxID=343512 RepID=UPI003F99508C
MQCDDCIQRERSWQKQVHGDVRQAQGRSRRPSRVQQLVRRPQGVTLSIVVVTAAISLIAMIVSPITDLLAFQGEVAIFQPWRLITAALLHGGIMHLALNMLALWMLGPALEQAMGKLPFIATYIVTALAGSVAVPLLGSNSWVVGASGAIFGLFGVYIGLQRVVGKVDMSLLVIVGINLAYGFFVSGVAWQAHVGGLIAGFIIGFGGALLAGKRTDGKRAKGLWSAIGLTAVVSLALWGLLMFIRL